MSEPAESRQLSVWGMFVVTALFFGALFGGVAVMASGLADRPSGQLLILVVGGGCVAGVSLVGRVFGWNMYRRPVLAPDPRRGGSAADRPDPAGPAGPEDYDGVETPGPALVPPRLWNPNTVGLWSLLFSPAFGAYLLAANWRALGRPDRAAASMAWFWAAVGFVLFNLAYLFMPDIKAVDTVLPYAGLALLLGWYTADGRVQAKYVSDAFGFNYARRGWALPLLSATACLAVYGVGAFAAAGAFRTPDPDEVAAEVRPLIVEEYRKDPAMREVTVVSITLAHKGDKAYSGFVDVTADGQVSRMSLDVVVGLRSITWETKPLEGE